MKFLDGEEWKDVPGTKNVKISNKGRVRRGNKLLKQTKEKRGYMVCSFGGEVGRQRVHRIVAQMFCENPNPEEFTLVDHINGVKDCNEASNLRWCNQSLNMSYRHEQGTLVQHRKGYIVAVNLENNEGLIYKTIKDASEDLGLSSQIISNGLNGNIHNCHGYYFFRLSDFKNTIHMDDGEVMSGLFFSTGRWAETKKQGITLKIVDENDDGLSQEELRKKIKELIDLV